jgi:hypothetical protein
VRLLKNSRWTGGSGLVNAQPSIQHSNPLSSTGGLAFGWLRVLASGVVRQSVGSDRHGRCSRISVEFGSGGDPNREECITGWV